MATKNLVEAYKNRINVADAYHAQTHNGQKMDSYKKLLIANSLNNVSRFMTEAFENSAGTQRAALGDMKKFCLTLTTLALPNMIAPELVLTVPMASRTGFVAYINYIAGSNKGDVRRGDLFNGTYQLGEMTDSRVQYTGQAIVETIPAGETQIKLAWEPVIGTVEAFNKKTGEKVEVTLDSSKAAYDKRMQLQNKNLNYDGEEDSAGEKWDDEVWGGYEEKKAACGKQGSSILLAHNDVNDTLGVFDNGSGRALGEVFATIEAQEDDVTVRYMYDNVVIPQNDIPHINARLEEITLAAHARRIAISYSQIANFQAKTDYGFDLGDNLAKQAIGELQYEIDSEIVAGLANAVDPALVAEHNWSKTQPVGVSLQEHYQGFQKMFDELATDIYLKTLKFAPNYMVCARDVITVLSFLQGWNPAPLNNINGPYYAGSWNGVKVYVSPMLAKGSFFVGVNGSDLQTSAAVYGVYMPVVPTQLLGFADGAMQQGFSTLYDFQILSKYEKDGHFYSPLLTGGRIVD